MSVLFSRSFYGAMFAVTVGLVTACSAEIVDPDPDPRELPPPGTETPPPTVEDCPLCVGGSPFLRLTRAQYRGTITEVLGEDFASGIDFSELPVDGRVKGIVSNVDSVTEPATLRAYQVVAEQIGRSFASDLDCTTRDCLEQSIRSLGSLLFRGPVDDDDIFALLALYDLEPQARDGVALSFGTLLQFPEFIYIVERGEPTDEEGTVRLTGLELATRLSMFIWRQSPDAELRQAAIDGMLDDAESVAAQTRRLLQDPRSDSMIWDFHRGWLGLDLLESRTFESETLATAMLEETRLFVNDAFRNRGATIPALLTGENTFANSELAAHYHLAVDGEGFVPVAVPGGSGLLTHGSFLISHAPEAENMAIYRGKMIRTSFLCGSLPRPPEGIPPASAEPGLTRRQSLETLTQTEGTPCVSCHVLMNPIGFLFENFDEHGQFEEWDEMHEIDATGYVVNSDIQESLEGVPELGHALAGSLDVEHCVTQKWFDYLAGRPESDDDAGSYAQAFAAFENSDGDLREFIIAMTATPAYRLRRPWVEEEDEAEGE